MSQASIVFDHIHLASGNPQEVARALSDSAVAALQISMCYSYTPTGMAATVRQSLSRDFQTDMEELSGSPFLYPLVACSAIRQLLMADSKLVTARAENRLLCGLVVIGEPGQNSAIALDFLPETRGKVVDARALKAL